MATRIQKRRDLAANWAATNPILAQGEEALETDTGKEKMGDGVTPWNSLGYEAGGGGSGVSTVESTDNTLGVTNGSGPVANLARSAITGDVSIPGASNTATLATVGSAGTVGDAQHVAQVTTDAKGRVTSAAAVTINDTTKLPLAGGTMTGQVNFGGLEVLNALNPTLAQSLATKAYVDAVAAGLSARASCACATTTTLPAYTHTSNTITVNATGTLTIDGHLVAQNDRVLVKNETGGNQPYNGIYICTTAGATGIQAVLGRSADMTTGTQFPGAFTFIVNGTANGGTGWICNNTGTVTVDTTNINFVQFSSSGSGVATVTATDTSIVVGGTATNPTIATGTLDVVATQHPPAANWSNNSHKITAVTHGAAANEVATFDQIPTTASGVAAFQNLIRTAVKTTGTYNANPGDLVPCDTTSGAVTVNLPNAPADASVVAVKHVTQGVTSGTGNIVTVACQGSDTMDTVTGPTSGPLPLPNETRAYVYQASTKVWTAGFGLARGSIGPAKVTTQTNTAYTAAVGEIVLMSTGNTTRVLTLPAVAINQQVYVTKIDSGTGSVTVTPASGTINGAATYTLNVQYQTVLCVSDGTNWFALDAEVGSTQLENVIRANSLDQLTAPAAAVTFTGANGAEKLAGLAPGSTVTNNTSGVNTSADAANLAQVPTVTAVTQLASTVTACTNVGTTVTFTSAFSATVNNWVTIAGVTGFTTNNPNGTFQITATGSGTFNCVVGAAPTGSYSSGGTVNPAFVPAITGLYDIEVIGGGGGGAGAGSAANSSATLQVGGGGGGQGESKKQVQTLTAGTAYTCTVGAGGASASGGAANNHAGTNGNPGANSTFAGVTNIVASLGGGGVSSAGNSTTQVNGGGFGNTLAATANTSSLAGQGGPTANVFSTNIGQPGGPSVGRGCGGGAAGAGASATQGGLGGLGASFTAALGSTSGQTGSATGGNGGAGAQPGGGGGGGGGGAGPASGGAGGNGGAGGAGGIYITGPLV